jgi:hypothetical protein
MKTSRQIFCHSGIDQKVPDHSTLTVFGERLLPHGKLMIFQGILEEIVQITLQGSSICFPRLQDSGHSLANMNTASDKKGRTMADIYSGNDLISYFARNINY